MRMRWRLFSFVSVYWNRPAGVRWCDVSSWGLAVVVLALAEPSDPGLGATVPTPPTGVLIAGWVIGIIALAIFWAASRR